MAALRVLACAALPVGAALADDTAHIAALEPRIEKLEAALSLVQSTTSSPAAAPAAKTATALPAPGTTPVALNGIWALKLFSPSARLNQATRVR